MHGSETRLSTERELLANLLQHDQVLILNALATCKRPSSRDDSESENLPEIPTALVRAITPATHWCPSQDRNTLLPMQVLATARSIRQP